MPSKSATSPATEKTALPTHTLDTHNRSHGCVPSLISISPTTGPRFSATTRSSLARTSVGCATISSKAITMLRQDRSTSVRTKPLRRVRPAWDRQMILPASFSMFHIKLARIPIAPFHAIARHGSFSSPPINGRLRRSSPWTLGFAGSSILQLHRAWRAAL